MSQLIPEYLAAGANRHPSAADWDPSGLLAFGADRNIALWQPQVSELLHLSRDLIQSKTSRLDWDINASISEAHLTIDKKSG